MSQDPPFPAARARALEVSLVVLLAGAVLMATEVLAFRVIGRTFGSALRETSAVIAVFLAAMSAGYALGGIVGDRRPRRSTLTAPLCVAGAWVASVPFFDRAVTERVAISNLPLSLHALVANLMLFAVPAALLASVSPIAIRLLTPHLARAGRVAGGISAISAAGSIAGTLVTGFGLIGSYAIPTIFRGLGATLALAALITAVGRRRLSLALAAGLVLAGPVGARVVHEHDSAHHNIRVVDRGAFRHLFFDDTRQSRMKLDDPTQGGYAYTRLFHLAWVFDESIERVLFIGLGGGTGPREFLADYPEVSVAVAEVDPAVVRIAHEYFALPRTEPRLEVQVIDGRVALRRNDATFDLIVVDAYNSGKYGSTIPFHLTTLEFFDLARSRLRTDGLLVYNVVEKMDDLGDVFLRALVKTVRTSFDDVYLFETVESYNTIVVACVGARNLDVETISLRASRLLESGKVTRPDYVEDALAIYDGEVPTDDVPVLTDDYAPVDRLLGQRSVRGIGVSPEESLPHLDVEVE